MFQETSFSDKLFVWYERSKRSLPWRKVEKNPYHTWLSEIMLQQTTVATVGPYFERFIRAWPRIEDLATASLNEVLVAWQGLGYYSRARNLHKCAQLLVTDFPTSEEELVKLPGIGPYTAAAIASIAFGRRAAAVDGNVIRVISRYEALPTAHYHVVKSKLLGYLPEVRCGDFTEALMELGALVCRPKNPSCSLCPLQETCKAYALGQVDRFPIKAEKKKLPTRYATAFIIQRGDGALWLRRRPPQGLLGGMMEVPTTPWTEEKGMFQQAVVRHTFTHFHFEVDLCFMSKPADQEGLWVQPKDLKQQALPTVMKKIIAAGLRRESAQNSSDDDSSLHAS